MEYSINGYVELELIDAATGKVKQKIREHNSITPVGLKSFLATCLTPYLQNNQILLGSRGVSPIGFTNAMSTTYLYTYNKSNSGLISPLLLNIDQTNGVKISSESFIDCLDDNLFISSEKLIGYGLNNVSPSSDSKEGTIEYPNASTVLDDYTLGLRFKYPEGVATGEINAVSMVPILDSSHNLALYTTKNLMQVAVGSSPSPSSHSLVCPAYCGDCSEVEGVGLNYTSDGLQGYIYNFLTGEVSNTSITQGVPYGVCDTSSNWFIDVESGYAYRCFNNVKYTSIYIYNIATGSSVKSFNISNCNYTYPDFLYLNGELYICISGNFGNSSTITGVSTKVYKLSKGSYEYYSTYETTELTLESLGVAVPEGACYLIGSRRSDSEEYEVRGLEFTKYNTAPTLTPSYAFTSLSNIHSTIIGVRGSGAIGSGLPISKTNPKLRYYYTSNNYSIRTIYNNSLSGTTVSTEQYSSQFINDSGNALSVYLLSSPVTKGENDILHVTYGYKITTS